MIDRENCSILIRNNLNSSNLYSRAPVVRLVIFALSLPIFFCNEILSKIFWICHESIRNVFQYDFEHSWKILILCSKFGLFAPLFSTKGYFKLKFITAPHHPLSARKPFHLFISFIWTNYQPWTFNQKVTFVQYFLRLVLVTHMRLKFSLRTWNRQNEWKSLGLDFETNGGLSLDLETWKNKSQSQSRSWDSEKKISVS